MHACWGNISKGEHISRGICVWYTLPGEAYHCNTIITMSGIHSSQLLSLQLWYIPLREMPFCSFCTSEGGTLLNPQFPKLPSRSLGAHLEAMAVDVTVISIMQIKKKKPKVNDSCSFSKEIGAHAIACHFVRVCRVSSRKISVCKKVLDGEAASLHLKILSFPMEMTHSSWLFGREASLPLDETLLVLHLWHLNHSSNGPKWHLIPSGAMASYRARDWFLQSQRFMRLENQRLGILPLSLFSHLFQRLAICLWRKCWKCGSAPFLSNQQNLMVLSCFFLLVL